MPLRVLIVFVGIVATGCSSSGKDNLDNTPDMIGLVLKNYGPDFKYCLGGGKNHKLAVEFVLLPGGMAYNVRVTGQADKDRIECVETVISRAVFPPVKDKTAKNIKRDLEFRWEKQQ
ncbi:MAG: hypothetical protein JXA66_06905 [Oligoflexia bacterium]|nr:hypothetical protein [Oligoflexia bacterium]